MCLSESKTKYRNNVVTKLGNAIINLYRVQFTPQEINAIPLNPMKQILKHNNDSPNGKFKRFNHKTQTEQNP